MESYSAYLTTLSSLTVNLWRPFARRRESTARPSLLFMRARNPCVFARLRLLGWNVLLGTIFEYKGGGRVCQTLRLFGGG